jgi:hypothetical protein
MDIRCFLSIAAGSGAALMPHLGMAQAVQLEPVTGALALGAQSSSLFNLQPAVRGDLKRPELLQRLDTVREVEAPEQEEIKIRWRYQSSEDGPRFEVGSYGSGKGAMKSRLLHVGMDWDF